MGSPESLVEMLVQWICVLCYSANGSPTVTLLIPDGKPLSLGD